MRYLLSDCHLENYHRYNQCGEVYMKRDGLVVSWFPDLKDKQDYVSIEIWVGKGEAKT